MTGLYERERKLAVERGWYATWTGKAWESRTKETGEPDINRAHAFIRTGLDLGPGAAGTKRAPN
jgi:hypothetical protein